MNRGRVENWHLTVFRPDQQHYLGTSQDYRLCAIFDQAGYDRAVSITRCRQDLPCDQLLIDDAVDGGAVLVVWNYDAKAMLIGEPPLVEGMFHRECGAEIGRAHV